jgi:hypothetical protein
MSDRTGDLIATLRSTIEARLETARAAAPGPWRPNAEHDEVLAVDGVTVCDGFALSGGQLRATVEHIAANDPASMISLYEGLLRIVDEHDDAHECPSTSHGPAWSTGWFGDSSPCPTLRILADALGIDTGGSG